MNIVQLRAFVTVVEHQSFSGAARALGLSQPAVTMQVQSLESEAGATLLDRRYRNVVPTEAGALLLPHARRVLAELEEARYEIDRMSERVTGRLDVAASTTPGDYILPGLLGGFLARYPEVGVSLNVMDTVAVVEAVVSGIAQVGMTGAEPGAGGRAAFERAGTDELVVLCPADSALTHREGLLASDLVEEAFVMRREGSGTRLVTEEALRAGGVDPGDLCVMAELGTSEAIVRAVEGHLGVGVVSRWVAEKALALGTVAELDVRGFPVERPFFLVTRPAPSTRAAEAFIEYVREAL